MIDLIQELDAHFDELAKLDAQGHRQPIRGSALGHCPRRLRAKLEGLEQRDLTPRSKRIFTMGDDRDSLFSDALRTRLTAKGYEVHVQGEVWTTLDTADNHERIDLHERIYAKYFETFDPSGRAPSIYVTGPGLSIRRRGSQLQVRSRCDVYWVDRHLADTVYLCELKTMSKYQFAKIGDSSDMGYDYRMQLMGQIAGLEQHGWSEVHAGWLIECKDNCELKWVPFTPTRDDWSEFDRACSGVFDLLVGWANGHPITESHALYASTAGRSLPWQCNYCDIGPLVGECVPAEILRNTAQEGEIPKWVIDR